MVCPGTVITEFPGMQIGLFYRSYCDLSNDLFLNRSSGFGDDICSVCWDTGLDDTPNPLLLSVFEWWNTHNWENNKGLTPSGHIKESNPDAPILFNKCIVG